MEWQVALPCLPSMVPVARRLARALMTDCPRQDDAELVLAELAANAVRYGGGEMRIAVLVESGWARLAVTDLGPDTEGVMDMPGGGDQGAVVYEDDLADQGLGLFVVGALATRWGHHRDLDGRNTVWAELEW